MEKSILICYRDIIIGTLIEDNDGYKYFSDCIGEQKVLKEYFLPDSYMKSMYNSKGENIGKRIFVEEMADRLRRNDIAQSLEITPHDSAFTVLQKLSLSGNKTLNDFKFSDPSRKTTPRRK